MKKVPMHLQGAYSNWLVARGNIKDNTPIAQAIAETTNAQNQNAFMSEMSASAEGYHKEAMTASGDNVNYRSVAGKGIVGTYSMTLIFDNSGGGATVKYYAFDADGVHLTNADDAARTAATGGTWGATTGARAAAFTGNNPVSIKNITYNSKNATSVNLEFSFVASEIDGTQTVKPINFAAQVSPYQNQPGIYKFPYSGTIDATKMLRLSVAAADIVSVTFDVEAISNVYGMSATQ